jgi:hypothetical protein
MWKNVPFWLWKVQNGTSSLQREMERPSKQVAWGEEKFVVTEISPPPNRKGSDIIRWGKKGDGKFHIKEAYQEATGLDNKAKNPLWSKVWNP